jgi:class 3 adenylate cyclase
VVQHNSLEQIVSSLEAYRHILGNDVVDLSVAALKQKLGRQLDSLPVVREQPVHQTQAAVILVADLVNYTALSARLDAEELHVAMNQVWQWLDRVIQRWDGHIEQHRGDGLVAVFSLNRGQDAPQRSVWAALAMQAELTLLQQQTHLLPRHALQMRIGLHLGNVTIGLVGSEQATMSVGETVRVAEQLEQLAPVGSALISHELYQLVGRWFEVEPFMPADQVAAEAVQPLATATYLVVGDKPRNFWRHLRLNETIPHLIGREQEHDLLQQTLMQVVAQQQAHMLTILGRMGLGKSHLLYHFEQWLNLAPVSVLLLRGRVQPDWLQWPVSPLGNVLADLLGLRLHDSHYVLTHKIRTGLQTYLPAADVSEATAVLESWLGLSSDSSTDTADRFSLAKWLMVLVQLLQGVVAKETSRQERPIQAVVLLLEDLHRADESSLNFIEALFRQCQDLPLLLLASGRHTLRGKRPSWPTAIKANRHTLLKLLPLSIIDTRHLASAFMPQATTLPLTFYDFLVTEAKGIPLYIREAIRLLQLEGDLLTGDAAKSAFYSHRPGMLPALPRVLSDLFEYQLATLPQEMLVTLQQAAVVGYRFWDTAVSYLSSPKLNGRSESDVAIVLDKLRQAGLIRWQPFSVYRGAQAFSFNHMLLRRLLYQQVPAAQRQIYQQQMAVWHQQQQANRRGAFYLPGLANAFTASLQDDPTAPTAVRR